MLHAIHAGDLVRLRTAVFDDDEDLVEDGTVTYRHGAGSLVPELEAALTGLAVGAVTEVRVTLTDGPLAGTCVRVVAGVVGVRACASSRPRTKHRRPKVALRTLSFHPH